MNVGNTRRVALAVSLLVAFCDPQVGAGGAAAPTTVIAAVTLISPERPAPLTHAYVRIANGRIADVSTHPLKGDVTVDGRGKFLIPGLIDSHMHLGSVPGMQAPQRAAHPHLVAQAVAQEPRSYLYFGFTTVLSLGDTAEPIHRWNALDVRPDAYFCGGTPIVNGYAFTSVAANPYFLFNPDQASALPAAVDRAAHAPGAVVERMARDGAICVKSYRETGFGWITAGVSTRQLFLAATIENARILHLDREIGSIERGKRANLLLMRANPLDSVEAYNTIETVFLGGRLIPRERLSASP